MKFAANQVEALMAGAAPRTPVRVGLFLGMGPIAGADFYKKFEESFMGLPDHDHPIVYCYSDPTMPRKDAGVDGTGANPLPALCSGIDFFRSNGVDFILAPCNTLMYYRQTLEAHGGVPILDIVHEVVIATRREHPNAKRIGLMSTAATRTKGLYHRAFRSELDDVEIVELDDTQQALVSDAIEGVKRGLHLKDEAITARLALTARQLVDRGAQLLVLGCTELPCALSADDVKSAPIVDSALVLARAGASMTRRIQLERELKVSDKV